MATPSSRSSSARENARGDADEADGGGVREHAELGAARRLGRVLDLEAEAEVRLVAPVPRLRLRMGHAREGRRHVGADAFAPDRGAHALHEREEVLLVREGHLDVELRDLLDAVGPEILVPEADRDLVVAVEPADDEQLLEDLRRLRQREEAALLEPARDDEVARALGRRLEEDRRLDVEEAVGLHFAPDGRDQAGPEPEIPLHPRPPQVDPAISEAQRLVHTFLVELERQRRRARDDLERVNLQLDLARGQLGVDVLGRAPDDLAFGAQDELVANLVGAPGALRRPLRIEHELTHAARVAKVDEDEAAMIPPRVDPAREGDAAADLLESDLAAHEVAPSHPRSSSSSASEPTWTSSRPGRRSTWPSPSTTSVARAPRRPACVSWPLRERPA